MGLTRYVFDNNNNRTNNNEEVTKKHIDLNPLYISHSKFENDWVSLFHTHPFSELFFVRSGRGSLLTEDGEYPLTEGDFIIINANTSHTEKSSINMPLEYISVAVKDIYFSFSGFKEYIILNCQDEQKDLKFYMTTILHELMHKKHDYESVCKNLLEVLIIKLMRWTDFSFEIESSTRINRECIKIKRHIDFNFMQDITLDTLAQLSHMNKYYMSHAFSRCFGCSPIQYLCQVRIQNSKDLLANTDFNITNVAHLSGFSSHSYFAQSFQKSCGMTASAYRKECKDTKEQQESKE